MLRDGMAAGVGASGIGAAVEPGAADGGAFIGGADVVGFDPEAAVDAGLAAPPASVPPAAGAFPAGPKLRTNFISRPFDPVVLCEEGGL